MVISGIPLVDWTKFSGSFYDILSSVLILSMCHFLSEVVISDIQL